MEHIYGNENKHIKGYVQDDLAISKLMDIKNAFQKKGKITDEEMPVLLTQNKQIIECKSPYP